MISSTATMVPTTVAYVHTEERAEKDFTSLTLKVVGRSFWSCELSAWLRCGRCSGATTCRQARGGGAYAM